MSDVEKRVNDNYSNLENVVKSLESQLAEKSEEIMNIRESKRHFARHDVYERCGSIH